MVVTKAVLLALVAAKLVWPSLSGIEWGDLMYLLELFG